MNKPPLSDTQKLSVTRKWRIADLLLDKFYPPFNRRRQSEDAHDETSKPDEPAE